MLAERRNALLLNQEKWKEKAELNNRRSSDVNVAKVSSLEARKNALLQASGEWKSRVQNDESINSLNSSYRLQNSCTSKTPLSTKFHSTEPKSVPRHTRLFPTRTTTTSESCSKVKELAKTAIVFRPKEESKDERNNDMEKCDVMGRIQRQSPLISGIRRPTKPQKTRPPSAIGELSVDVSKISSIQSVKRSPISDKENNDDSLKEPPAKQPFTRNVSEDRTPKLGLKNCGIALKKPDIQRVYPNIMLIRCKGSKNVDVRLVAPYSSSVHDCATFVLITAERLFIFEGEFSSVLERSKAKQIAHSVISTKDLSCSASKFEHVKDDSRAEVDFWKLLGNKEDSRKIPAELEKFIDPESAEAFEDAVKVSNTVFLMDLDGKATIVLEDEIPHSSILDSSKVLVFDFGTEIYVWLGHDSDRSIGKPAMEFAEKLRSLPINCSEIVASIPNGEAKRPDWILIRKFTEGLPDCLFRLKFSDPLPEPTAKTPKIPKFTTERFVLFQKKSGKIAPVPECGLEELLKDEDELIEQLAEKILNEEPRENVLELEETELHHQDESIFTEGLLYFHLKGEVLEELETLDEFFDTECYVLKWLYRIERAGIRKLDGTPGIQKDTGRQRVAYFYWFGEKCSRKAKGSLALALRKFDKDRREHILIEQGCQSLMFLKLFDGKMIISSSDLASTSNNNHKYIIHGSTDTYFYAEELDEAQPLRIQTCYIFVDSLSKTVSQWNGKLASKQIIKGAARIAEKIAASKNFALTSSTSNQYQIIEAVDWRYAPIIFRLFDSEAEQLNSPQFTKTVNFTFRQIDLKFESTFLVDQGSKLWIWSNQLVTTFHLQVASKYWKSKNRISKPATVIYKGKEPDEFKALFPSWTSWPSDKNSAIVEFEAEEPQSLDTLLLSRTRWRPLQDVLERRLPNGCDTKRLEKFLNDEDFSTIFKMDRAQFYRLPKWKQTNLKKEAKLF